jgi:hypothetical protein
VAHIGVERDLSGAVRRVVAAYGDDDPARLIALSIALFAYVDSVSDILGIVEDAAIEIHFTAHVAPADVRKIREKVGAFVSNRRLRGTATPRVVIDPGFETVDGRTVIAA